MHGIQTLIRSMRGNRLQTRLPSESLNRIANEFVEKDCKGNREKDVKKSYQEIRVTAV